MAAKILQTNPNREGGICAMTRGPRLAVTFDGKTKKNTHHCYPLTHIISGGKKLAHCYGFRHARQRTEPHGFSNEPANRCLQASNKQQLVWAQFGGPTGKILWTTFDSTVGIPKWDAKKPPKGGNNGNPEGKMSETQARLSPASWLRLRRSPRACEPAHIIGVG